MTDGVVPIFSLSQSEQINISPANDTTLIENEKCCEIPQLKKNQKEDFNSQENEKNEKEDETNGRWTEKEHQLFLEALKLYGKNWKKVQAHVGTRTTTQARSHAQKYFAKLGKVETSQSGKLQESSPDSTGPSSVSETPISPPINETIYQIPKCQVNLKKRKYSKNCVGMEYMNTKVKIMKTGNFEFAKVSSEEHKEVNIILRAGNEQIKQNIALNQSNDLFTDSLFLLPYDAPLISNDSLTAGEEIDFGNLEVERHQLLDLASPQLSFETESNNIQKDTSLFTDVSDIFNLIKGIAQQELLTFTLIP